MNPTSPFSIEELKTQEERLEILSKKEDLSIGVPKEDPAFEKRVCLTPDAVSALIANNHKVLVESGAGNASSFTDEDYIKAGARASIMSFLLVCFLYKFDPGNRITRATVLNICTIVYRYSRSIYV